jgi:hypothetical protein
LPDEHDKESADDKSSTHGDGAIVVGTLVPRDEGMVLLVVALSAPIVVAASLIEAEAGRQQFRDARLECDKCSGEHDRHAEQLKRFIASRHGHMMVGRALMPGTERSISKCSSDLFNLQLLMNVLREILEHLIKLGTRDPVRLKVESHILDHLLKT